MRLNAPLVSWLVTCFWHGVVRALPYLCVALALFRRCLIPGLPHPGTSWSQHFLVSALPCLSAAWSCRCLVPALPCPAAALSRRSPVLALPCPAAALSRRFLVLAKYPLISAQYNLI